MEAPTSTPATPLPSSAEPPIHPRIGTHVVIFDGHCNFCSRWVNFILKRDHVGKFSFASAQSSFGRNALLSAGLNPDDLQSLLVVTGGRALVQSDAVLEILTQLGGFGALAGGMKILPRFVRDGMYRVVARNRYRWFGKRETCMIPSEQDRSRFVS